MDWAKCHFIRHTCRAWCLDYVCNVSSYDSLYRHINIQIDYVSVYKIWSVLHTHDIITSAASNQTIQHVQDGKNIGTRVDIYIYISMSLKGTVSVTIVLCTRRTCSENHFDFWNSKGCYLPRIPNDSLSIKHWPWKEVATVLHLASVIDNLSIFFFFFLVLIRTHIDTP